MWLLPAISLWVSGEPWNFHGSVAVERFRFDLSIPRPLTRGDRRHVEPQVEASEREKVEGDERRQAVIAREINQDQVEDLHRSSRWPCAQRRRALTGKDAFRQGGSFPR